MGCDVPNLGSVVGDCGDTCPAVARQATCSVSETPRKCSFVGQKVRCREPSLSARLLPLSAPNIGSESVVAVCIDRAEEVSCVVSDAIGSPC